MNIVAAQQGTTLSSEDLFAIVNEARDFAGEPTLQYSHFLARAEDELDENIHYKNFVVKNLPNGTKRPVKPPFDKKTNTQFTFGVTV